MLLYILGSGWKLSTDYLLKTASPGYDTWAFKQNWLLLGVCCLVYFLGFTAKGWISFSVLHPVQRCEVKSMFEKLMQEREKKSMLEFRQPLTCRHPIYTWMLSYRSLLGYQDGYFQALHIEGLREVHNHLVFDFKLKHIQTSQLWNLLWFSKLT